MASWLRQARCLIAFMVLFTARSGSAQEALPPEMAGPLTLEECIQLGLERASSVRTSELDRQLSELRVKDASAAYLPTIQTDGSYGFNDRVDFGFKRENVELGVSADYLIWDQGRRGIALKQARTGLNSSVAQLEQRRQGLAFAIVQAYYDLLKAEKLTSVDRVILEQSRGHVERIRTIVELGGNAIEADIAAAEVLVATDELNLLNDQNAIETARADLAAIIGLDPATTIAVVDDPEFAAYLETGRIPREARTLDELTALALAQRPEVAQSTDTIRILELEKRLAELNRYPRLNAQGNFNADVASYLDERGAFNRFRTWDVRAILQFPIFDGGTSRRDVERTVLTLSAAQEDDSELRRNLTLDVRQAYLNLQLAEKRLEISVTQVRNARISLEAARERYAQELIILLELLEAQSQYAESTTNQIRSYYDFKVAQRALQRAIGKVIE